MLNRLILPLVQTLPFAKVQHKVMTLDAQPSSPTLASLIVCVTGLLVVSGDERYHRSHFIIRPCTFIIII